MTANVYDSVFVPHRHWQKADDTCIHIEIQRP